MNCTSFRIPYRQANAFSHIALDYIDHAETLQPFYSFAPSLAGIQQQIEQRKNVETDRNVLVNVLNEQYQNVSTKDVVSNNIKKLIETNCFTVTTAHQPNLFTGPLYFIYKILHAIKLAEHLQQSFPDYSFVPVYYMGSEDADFDELGHFYLDGEKKEWKSKQTGAFGRMKTDKELIKIIETLDGQLSIFPHGKEIIQLIKDFFKEGETIQQATFQLINALFGQYGLIVLIADHPALKEQMNSIFKDDLLNQLSSNIVQETSAKLDENYKIQANPREINLFYMADEIRSRIEWANDHYIVHGTQLKFSKDELLHELETHPERFSPNVILRAVFQETILPNIAFIGGGVELAYWLQLKDLFNHYKVPFPVLVLRNSFLIIEEKWKKKIQKLKIETDDIFLPADEIINKKVTEDSKNELSLNGTYQQANNLYESLMQQAGSIDKSLITHVERLKTQQLEKLKELEKKMLRAEKRKFSDQRRQVENIKNRLFPKNGLQERYDNILFYYAVYGSELLDKLYDHSLALEQEFTVLEINN